MITRASPLTAWPYPGPLSTETPYGGTDSKTVTLD